MASAPASVTGRDRDASGMQSFFRRDAAFASSVHHALQAVRLPLERLDEFLLYIEPTAAFPRTPHMAP